MQYLLYIQPEKGGDKEEAQQALRKWKERKNYKTFSKKQCNDVYNDVCEIP